VFGKLNIEQKLLFSFVFFIVLTVGLGIFSIVKFGEEDSVATDLAGNAVAGIRIVAQMDDLVTSFRRGELLLAISQDPAGKEKYIKRMEDDAEKLKLCFAKYEKLIDSDVERRTFGEFSSNWDKFLVEHTKVVEVARQGNLAQVDAVIKGDSSKYFNLAIKALKENEDGQLGLAQKECEDLLSGSRRTRFSIVAVLLVCIVLGLGFGMRVARRISAPLRHLVEKAARVAQGDMTVHIENETGDEVGRLADAFNGMLGSLKEIIGKVIDLSGQVAAAAEQLQSEALVMAKDSDQVVAQTNTIAAASEEMSATSGTIAANCELAAENSGHANDAASSGAVIINATVEGMNRIAEFVRESSATVAGLGEQSNRIGAIVGTI
jgi:methyl-accepting chemotaxis protein